MNEIIQLAGITKIVEMKNEKNAIFSMTDLRSFFERHPHSRLQKKKIKI
jgi:hypothetical protein